MKRLLILLIITFTVQTSFGQACGIYRLKYIGKINSETLNIEKIRLPTTEYLHGSKDKDSSRYFIETKLISNEINVEIYSDLTSVFGKAENLLRYYKSKRKTIPIIFVVKLNGKDKEIIVEIPWENVRITKLNTEDIIHVYEIDLDEIGIK